MATKFQIKRTSVSGRSPNTTNQANSGYIAAGELAVNLIDEKVFSSNGTVAFEVGANLSNISVGGNAALGKIVANGSLGTAGQKLTANSTGGLYWDTASAGITVELVNSTSNVTTVTTVSTLQFDEDSGFDITNPSAGIAKVAMNSTFKYWQVDGVQKLTATGLDTVNFIAGNNITITANGANTPQSIAFSTSLTPTFTSATFGNSTVNTTVNSTAIAVTQVVANNTTGTPGQVLTSNGTGVYWSYKPTQDITLNTFTGNGSNTQFKLSTTVEPERTLVFINGIIQRPTTDYTITNGTITFTNSAPLQDDIIQVRIIGFENLGDAEYITDDYLGNGSNTIYTLSTSQSSNNYSFVFLNGIAQVPGTDYSISGSTLTFTVAPPNNEKIRVTSLNFYDDLVTTVYTANGTATIFGLPHNTTSKRVFVSLNGLNQAPVTDFNVSANTLTFTNPPAANDTVIIRSYALADDSAGANTTVQYNKSGVLAGSLGFVFNETTNNVTVGNTLVVPNLIISASNPPANSSAAGTTGTITWDSSYIYVAIGTNTWKKIAISANGAAGGGGSGLVRDSFTGNGANINFTLSTAPVNEAQTLVFVDRVLQRDADYFLTGTTLTFAVAPDNNAEIDVYIADPAATEVAGANTNIIFNDSDIAGGSAAFTFNKTTNTVALSNTLTVGSNLTINTSTIFIGNSTVNTTIIAGNVNLQGTQLKVGNVVVNGNQLTLGNVTITDTQITVGNSTVNTVLGSTGSLSGNGSQLTSVNAIALQGNSVNDILLAANTAANTLASAAFSNAATRADNAYSNATTYASNADNISSGTLNTARLPATVNVSTTINVGANVNINTSTIFIGNSTVNTTIAAGNINLQGTQLTVGNVTVTGDSYTIGNGTVNTTISGGSITINGVNVNTAITSNAAAAFTNAVAYANTTFLPLAGGTLTGNLTVNATANIVSNLAANNATFRGDVQIDGNLTVSGTSVVINATSLAVEDNMIYLNNGSQVSHPDLGFAGNYNDGSYKHAGFFRDATDGVWKLFDGYTPEPDASAYIDTSNASFRIADFTANVITANSFSGNGASITSVNAATVGGNTASTLRTYSDTVAATAYSNAISYSGNAALAYSNATTYASNASNISSGTLAFARLPALYLGTTQIQSSSAAQAVSGITTLAAGNTTATGFVSASTDFRLNGLPYSRVAIGDGGGGFVGGYNITYNAGVVRDSLGAVAGIYNATAGVIRFYAGASGAANSAAPERLTINQSGLEVAGYINVSTNTATFGTAAYVVANGNVGVGTSSPAALIDVYSSTNLGSGANGIRVQRPGSYGQYGYLEYLVSSDQTVLGSLYTGGGASAFGQIYFRQHSSTTSVDSMVIASNNNVGIGTTTPSDKLYVNASTADSYIRMNSSSVGNTGIKISYNGSSAHGIDLFYYPNNAQCYFDSKYQVNAGTVYGDIYFRQNVAGTMTTRMTIKADGGNIGIGTTSPTISSGYGLHINSGSGHGGLKLQSTGRTFELLSTSSGYFTVYDTTGSADRLSIAANGNVGVGNTSPADSLVVSGAIRSHNENQTIDSRYYGGTFIRGWNSFTQGSESNLTYTTDSTSPVGTEVITTSSNVWARGPKIRLDRNQNYEVEFWLKKTSAGTSGQLYFVVSNYDSDGNIINGDGTDWHYPASGVGSSSFTQNVWYKFRYVVGPNGVKNHATNARYISTGFIINYGGGSESWAITGFKCRPIATAAPGSIIQTQVTSSATRTTVDSTSFVEPSSAYRVSITPSSPSNKIIVHYFIPMNPGGNYATNTIYSLRAFRIVSGSTSYSLTSAGASNGSRNVFAGQTIRPVGFDSNDPMFAHFIVYDEPGTTSTCTYGFDFKRETGGGGIVYFGYSAGDSSNWGYDTDVLIIAQEVVGDRLAGVAV